MKSLFTAFLILLVITCLPRSPAFGMTAGTTFFGPSACGITNYLLTTLPEYSILGTTTSGSSTTYTLTRFGGSYDSYQYQGSYFNELLSYTEQWFFSPDGSLTLVVGNGNTFTGTWSGSFSPYLGTYTLNLTVSIAPCNNYTLKGVTYYMGT